MYRGIIADGKTSEGKRVAGIVAISTIRGFLAGHVSRDRNDRPTVMNVALPVAPARKNTIPLRGKTRCEVFPARRKIRRDINTPGDEVSRL